MGVERAEEEVHQVVLADVTETEDLFTWQRGHRHVVQIADCDPLLHLSWEEHRLPNILVKELEEVVEDLSCDHFWLLFGYLGHDPAVHDEAWAIIFVASVQVKASRLEQADRTVGQARLWSY